MSHLSYGIVGLGVISKFYVQALERMPAVRLAAVCDVNENALRPFQGTLPCHLDYRRLLEQDGLDGVIVNVPNDRHFDICRDVIQAGLAVCVEKPLATRLDEGERLTDLAEEQGTVLFTAFHRRYNMPVRALQRRIEGGAPITAMTVRYFERIEDHVGDDGWYLDPERCGGGCVADNGPNAFDLVRMFLGDVEVVDAKVTRDAFGVDRDAVVTLRSAAGAQAVVELDWSYQHGELKDVEVHLAGGTVDRADMLDGYPEFKSSLAHEYVGVLEDFSRCVLAGRNLSHNGLEALRLVDSAYRAEGAAAHGIA